MALYVLEGEKEEDQPMLADADAGSSLMIKEIIKEVDNAKLIEACEQVIKFSTARARKLGIPLDVIAGGVMSQEQALIHAGYSKEKDLKTPYFEDGGIIDQAGLEVAGAIFLNTAVHTASVIIFLAEDEESAIKNLYEEIKNQ